MTDTKLNEWNRAYRKKDNFVFYPNEEIIRFVSKHIRKRVGLNEFIDQCDYKATPKVLDFGCGIGRHVKLLDEFGLEPYGFDLSEEAISLAKSHFKSLGLIDLIDKVIVADITNLPYENNTFDFMLSHGVLDSMPFEIAQKGMKELNRCLKSKGKIYFDLISINDSTCDKNQMEKTISTEHEEGTIQSYFDMSRINDLIGDLFKIIEIELKTQVDVVSGYANSRYHVVVEKS